MRTNLGLKILSLLLAVVIWLQLTLSADHNAVLNLKLDLKNAPQSLTLENIPKSVPFTVRGKGYDILRLMVNPPYVTVNAANMKPGTTTLSLDDYTIRNFSGKEGVDIIGPSGDLNLKVQADMLQQKIVEVRPVFTDNAARNIYQEKGFTFSPEKVSISGPRTKVSGIRSVEAGPVTSSMLSRDSFKLPLSIPDPSIIVNADNAIFLRARQQVVSRLIDQVRITSAKGESFFPSVATLKVEGPPALVESLRPDDIVAMAVADPEAGGWYNLQVELPEGIIKYSLTPAKVRLK